MKSISGDKSKRKFDWWVRRWTFCRFPAPNYIPWVLACACPTPQPQSRNIWRWPVRMWLPSSSKLPSGNSSIQSSWAGWRRLWAWVSTPCHSLSVELVKIHMYEHIIIHTMFLLLLESHNNTGHMILLQYFIL